MGGEDFKDRALEQAMEPEIEAFEPEEEEGRSEPDPIKEGEDLIGGSEGQS